MATHGFEVEGVDVSSTAVRWAEEHALELGIAAAFRVADVRTLADFADDSFDVVLDGRCLHCIIGNDRQLVLDAVRRVLRSGGVFVVRTMCDPNPDSPPPNFDLETYCAMRPDAADVATRYIGPAAAILDELGGAGFELVRHDHVREPGATTADLLAIMRTTD